MMLKVFYVTLNQKTQGYGLAAIQGAAVGRTVFGNSRDEVKDMTVKSCPELDEILPGFGLVSLRFDPLGLGVTRK